MEHVPSRPSFRRSGVVTVSSSRFTAKESDMKYIEKSIEVSEYEAYSIQNFT